MSGYQYTAFQAHNECEVVVFFFLSSLQLGAPGRSSHTHIYICMDFCMDFFCELRCNNIG